MVIKDAEDAGKKTQVWLGWKWDQEIEYKEAVPVADGVTNPG